MSNINAAPSDAVIRPGWEVGGSVFKTFDLLSALSKALSQDNVHPEAILAAEALGAGLIVAPERIQEAVDTLGGNENYRLLQTRITLGIHYGNTQRTLRQSTPLLQFFVFITAFKLTHLDEEIADVLYEMLSHTGLYKRHPVSPAMLQSLLEQINGQADSLAPMNLMHEIASKLSPHNPQLDVYLRLDGQSLAKLFTAVFEALREENVKGIRIEGHRNGVWIAAAIGWWLPGDFFVTVAGELLHGNPHGRVEVVLVPEAAQPWNLQIWTNLEHPTQVLVQDTDSFDAKTNKFPLSLLVEFYWAHDSMGKTPPNVTTIYNADVKQSLTELASSLIESVLSYGKLYINTPCCHNKRQHCSDVKIREVANQSWLDGLQSVLEPYGLGKYQANKNIVDAIGASLKLGSRKDVRAGIDRICSSLNIPHGFSRPSFEIALDAILTCTVEPHNIIRYASDFINMTSENNKELLVSLLCGNLDISTFRLNALKHLVSGATFNAIDTKAIAVAQEGALACMSILWNVSSHRRDSIAIKYIRGSIKHNDLRYRCIKDSPCNRLHEEGFASMPLLNKEDIHRAFQENGLPSDKRGALVVDLDTDVTAVGNTIHLRQSLVSRADPPQEKIKIRVSWLESIYALATAQHVMFRCIYMSLGSRYDASDRWPQLRWGTVCGVNYHGMPALKGCSVIVDTESNELVKVFVSIHSPGIGTANPHTSPLEARL